MRRLQQCCLAVSSRSVAVRISKLMLFLWLQQSLLTVLKESFKVYKAISEGLINLADRFFEMEYLDAHKGLEVYKESIVANDRLQQYYQQVPLLSLTCCCCRYL